MKSTVFIKSLAFAGVVAFAPVVSAQNVQSVFTQSVEKMKASDWQGAYDEINSLLESKDPEGALRKHGPMYGVFYYNLGICLDNLEKYEEAAEAYNQCYELFPNDPTKPNSVNFYRTYSLFKRGEALTRSEDFSDAASCYETFIKEAKGDKASSKTNWANCYINYSIALFKQGELREGLKQYEVALKNQNKFLTPPTSIFKAFDAFTTAALEKNDEKIVLKFLGDYRSKLITDPFTISQYSRGLIGKASQAVQANMDTLPLELLALVPNTDESINNLSAQLQTLKGAKLSRPLRDGYILVAPDYIKKLSDNLKDQARSDEPNESFTLNLTAFLWGKTGNYSAAFAAYEELELHYSNVKNREKNLFALVQAASSIGNVDATAKYGQTFLNDFPNSEMMGDIEKLMLSGLYANKEYDKCIEIASAILPSLESGSPSHELATFVRGGSLFYKNDPVAARTDLEQHKKDYPDSDYAIERDYMIPSANTRLGQFETAADQLDEFFAKHKDSGSPFLPYALFDRANCAYSLSDDDTALDKIGLLEKDYLGAPIIPAAFNLKGNVLESKEDYTRAEDYYKRAFEKAEQAGNKGVASESLFYLVGLLSEYPGEGDRSADAVTYYDQYWGGYSDGSPYQAQVAVVAYPALKKHNRQADGLAKMEEVVTAVANMPGQPQLEALVNTFRDEFLESNGIDALKDKFNNFPGISDANQETLALLKLSLIGAYEDELSSAKKAQKEDLVRKLEASTKVIFGELKNEFKPAILSPNALAKVGDYIRSNTGNPREALAYYEEIIKREDPALTHKAQFGIADVYAGSSAAADRDKAKGLLTELSANDQLGKKDREKALYRLIEINVAAQAWADTRANASAYMDAKYTRNLPKASYYYALAFDKEGNTSSALSAYQKTYFGNQGAVLVAAPSLKRMMEIYWERNTPAQLNEAGEKKTEADRQFAYNQGWVYVDATARHLPKMTDEEKKLREQIVGLVEQFEGSGQIVDMATQKKPK